MAEYKIREICGDWALDIPMGNDIVVLYFNSRANAEMVKNVLEWENAHPNEAIPYNTPTIDPENLRPRGRWKDACYYHDCPLCYECSNCGLKLMYKPNYCPHCGSFMENKNGENYAKK